MIVAANNNRNKGVQKSGEAWGNSLLNCMPPY